MNDIIREYFFVMKERYLEMCVCVYMKWSDNIDIGNVLSLGISINEFTYSLTPNTCDSIVKIQNTDMD